MSKPSPWRRRQFIGALAATAAGSLVQGGHAADDPIGAARGVVAADGKPIHRACVSDGYRVVVTDQSGRFELPLSRQSGPFVFLTLPRGYWTERFYLPTAEAAAGPIQFHLKRFDHTSDHDALFVTDIHLGEGRREESFRRFAATIDEINAMDPAPAFIWMGGDITLQGGKGQAYMEAIRRLKAPLRHIPGNHELHVSRADPRDEFHARLGPTYYSFDVGGVHYVALDGCLAVPEEKGYRNVHGRLSARELHWLAQDLQHVPDGKPVVVAVHIPLVSTYPERRGVVASDVPWWVMSNADEAIDLLARHNTRLVLQGHLHENERILQRGIEFVESISVCGRWWKTEGRENGVCGEPRGYRRLEARGEKVSHRYVGSAESRVDACGEIVSRPQALPKRADTELLINLFDAPPGAIVTAQVDDQIPMALESVTPVGVHEGARMAHHWRWVVNTGTLAAGRHQLTARCTAPDAPAESFQSEVTLA